MKVIWGNAKIYSYAWPSELGEAHSTKRLFAVRKLNMRIILCKSCNKLWHILTWLFLHGNYTWRLLWLQAQVQLVWGGTAPYNTIPHRQHKETPPETSLGPAANTTQVEWQDEAKEQKLAPNPPAQLLQWPPLPATYPWDLLLWQQKEQDLRLSEDVPNGMYPE